MNFEFMTIDTPLPPCMPFPRALTGFPVSSTAKVMYCRMLDAMLSKGQEDENGILFVCFPVTAIAAVLSRSPMTVKRSLNELETAGLIRITTMHQGRCRTDSQVCHTVNTLVPADSIVYFLHQVLCKPALPGDKIGRASCRERV